MKRACGCSYGGVGLGEKYLNTNFEAVQIVAANIDKLINLRTLFGSAKGTIKNSSAIDDAQWDIDVDYTGLATAMAAANFVEIMNLTGASEVPTVIAGTVKKVPLSSLINAGLGAQTVSSSNNTVIGAYSPSAAGSNLDVNVNPFGLATLITPATPAELATINPATEIFGYMGGTFKKIPMSSFTGGAVPVVDTFVSTQGTIVNTGADGSNLDLSIDMTGLASAVQPATPAEVLAILPTTTVMANIGGTIKEVPISSIAGVPDAFTSTGGTVVNVGADGSNLDLDVNHDVLFDRPAVITVGELALLSGTEEIWIQTAGGVRQMTLDDLFTQAPLDVSLATLAFNAGDGVLTATMTDGATRTVDLDSRYVQSVNAIAPDAAGNVALALTAVETGTLLARPVAPANATLYVVSNNAADPLQDGKTFIYHAANAAWYEIVGFDLASTDARYVNVAGDTLAGPLYLSADPTAALEAATKQYVDAVSVNTFASTGGTIVQTGANAKNLDLDINVAALDGLIVDANAGELAALTGASEVYAAIGGVMKRIPISSINTDAQNAAAVNLVTLNTGYGFTGTTVDAIVAQMAAKIDWIANGMP